MSCGATLGGVGGDLLSENADSGLSVSWSAANKPIRRQTVHCHAALILLNIWKYTKLSFITRIIEYQNQPMETAARKKKNLTGSSRSCRAPMIHSQHDTAVDMDSSVNKSAGHQHRLCSSWRSTARRKQRIDTSFRFSDIFDCEYKIFWQSYRSLARARTSVSLEAKKTMESKTLCVIYWQICSKIK